MCFSNSAGIRKTDLVVLMEMTLENLLSEGQLNHADFLARVDILGALGRTVLISKFGEYYRLAAYLSRYTNKMIGIVMGVPTSAGNLRREILSQPRRRNSRGTRAHV